jgi:UDP-glucose 4-epimerase
LFMQDEYFKLASVISLRYFNPVGSYKGLIGEKPSGIPNNLMPYIRMVALGEFDYLNIYGDDYDTEDGTGLRDYIHVMDLIYAHWDVLKIESKGFQIYNVGTGQAVSVKTIVKTFENVNQINIPFKIKPRRIGDIAICYASVAKIKNHIHWVAKSNLDEMCRDVWRVNS